MAHDLEELFVRDVEVGIATIDYSTDDGVVSDRAVTERITAFDRKSGEDRELLLVYGAGEVPTVADQLKLAAERAASTR
jgi:hypothetical protein